MSYCLRFADQAEYEANAQYIDGVVDVIGLIFLQNPDETATQIPGFHVNVVGEMHEELLPFIVFPHQHHREFFGVPVEKSIEFVGVIGNVIYVDVNGVRYGFE
jgi:hypothetical protein